MAVSTNTVLPKVISGFDDHLQFTELERVRTSSDKPKPFRINRIEDEVDLISFPIPPHRKTVHDLVILTKGHSRRTKGFNTYRFEENEVFFMPAYQISSYEMVSANVQGFYLYFSPNVISDFISHLSKFSFLNFTEHPIIKLKKEGLKNVISICHRLEDLLITEDLEMVKWYIMVLLEELKRNICGEKSHTIKDAATAVTEKYKSALAKHIYDLKTVKEFAILLNVTPNHLNKCVKKTLNKTAQELYNEMLILEGKVLLKYSGLTIAEIAGELGNRNPSNFSRFFKSQTDMTPKEYLHS